MFEQRFLENDINLISYKLPNIHSIEIGLYIKVGSMYEDCDNNGITHLLEHMHFRRLGDLSNEDLYYKTECMGTSLRGSTYKNMMYFHMKLRPQYIEKGLSFIKMILSESTWGKEDLEHEKKIVLNEIVEKTQYLDIEKLAEEKMWKDTSLSYPILGKENIVKNLTVEDLVEYKKRWFSKGRIFVVLTGAFSDSDIELVCKQLNDINLSSNISKSNILEKSRQFKRNFDVNIIPCSYEYMDVQLSFDVDKNFVDWNELLFLNSVIGEGDGGILSREIREKYGWTYDIHSYVNCYDNVMTLNIVFSTHKKTLLGALERIVITLQDIKRTLSNADLESNIVFFTENLLYLLDDCTSLNFELGCAAIMNEKIMSIEERIEKNRRINCKRLKEIARSIFVKENATLTILGNVSSRKQKEIKKLIIFL